MRPRLVLLAKVLFGVFLVAFAYGLYRFPDSPIRYVDGQYVGKYGALHSREDFEQMKLWERAYIGTFIASLISAVVARYVLPGGERRGL